MKWRKEAALQSWFTKWLRGQDGKLWLGDRGGAVAFELKLVARGKTLADSKVPEHQIVALERAGGEYGEVLVHKISDSAIGYKPCDGFVMNDGYGALVVGFDEAREVWEVDIRDYVQERGDRVRGSVSLEWFRNWGEQIK